MFKAVSIYVGVAAIGILSQANVSQAGEVLKAPLRACVKDGTKFGEVGSCGKVWQLGSGEAKLESDGKIKVEVKGLVLNDASTGEFNGTPDGVTHVVATLICGGSVAALAERVALSNPKGDAKIEATLKMPEKCSELVIVLREVWEGNVGGWLAATGK